MSLPRSGETVLQRSRISGLEEAAKRGASLNMTYLALSLSTYVNGVAATRRNISQDVSGSAIEAITNGVHAAT